MSYDKVQKSFEFIINEAQLLTSINDDKLILKKWHDIQNSLYNRKNELEEIEYVNMSLIATVVQLLDNYNKKEAQLKNKEKDSKNSHELLSSKLVGLQTKVSYSKKRIGTYEQDIYKVKKEIAAAEDKKISGLTNWLGPFAWITNAIRTGDATNLIPGYNLESAFENKTLTLAKCLAVIEGNLSHEKLKLQNTENKINELTINLENIKNDLIILSSKILKLQNLIILYSEERAKKITLNAKERCSIYSISKLKETAQILVDVSEWEEVYNEIVSYSQLIKKDLSYMVIQSNENQKAIECIAKLASSDTIYSGQSLETYESILSTTECFATLKPDGNFVVYHTLTIDR